jgi:hypothetical protein
MKIAGTEVADAKEDITITVTKNDVRLGSLKDAKSCAMAQAVCRQEKVDEARIHFSRAYIRKGKKWYRFGVPMALRNEIIAFDRGGAFEPGKYTLSPVQPSVRLGANNSYRDPNRDARGREEGGLGKRSKRKRPYHVVSGVRKRMMADWE